MRLSVVIPTYNEESRIARALRSVPPGAEAVVSDGGSSDRTREIAGSLGARVVRGPRRRGAQMNRGVERATGEALVFLHADCELPSGAGSLIPQALSREGVAGGCFRLRIESPRRSLRLIAFGTNLRARYLGLPYGDQALFVRRSLFAAVGGYPDLPLMEDVELVRRLRARGRIVCLPQSVTTLPRHWEALGPWWTTLVNGAAIAGYLAGVSPERLAPLYFRLRKGAGRSEKTETSWVG